ncbi:isochorismate synthase [Lentibacillus persicus]|uniref:Isochorismate synthase MenF n=1 Tax=Lentibacillus persicus TaxID=640948 RepID=A0A1I1WF38_9BACI|nr:isochorismate synthase [Lentibacillus persicus]SFD93641.1 isochorismate synthase [Lentibacillus persicus]
MIEVQEASLQSMLEKAINEAKQNHTARIMSMTKQINKADPIAFIGAGENLSMDRGFWGSTSEGFYIAGVGCAHEITAGSNRMDEAEKSWQKLRDEAIIHNPYKKPGTGLVTMGGMSFDPLSQRTSLWNNFPPLSLTVPEIVLTRSAENCYLTINVKVNGIDKASEITQRLNKLERSLLTHSSALPDDVTIEKKQEVDPESWKQTVRHATEFIKANKADKIVLARKLLVKLSDKSAVSTILYNLIEQQPNSYVFAFERNGDCFLGASPERLIKQEQEEVLSTCLAGTAPRGQTKEEDEQIAQSLLHDEKNRSEHEFVVKMIRQSMVHYCRAVNIPDNPVIYPLKNLQHLYTPVKAVLKEKHSIFDIIDKLHPTPALGGVPTEESLAFIREHEQLDRGWYGAPVGWMDSNLHGEFAVAIRSGLIQEKQASLFAGCGIVRDSDPDEEYKETGIKFMPMLSVLGG